MTDGAKDLGCDTGDDGSSVDCVCVDLLTGGESLCHDWVSSPRPVLSPHLEDALNKNKVLPLVK